MAKQESIIKFTGNIGDLSFFKTKDGFSARKKTGVSGDRIKNDPKYERTRENMEEFGRAAAASKLVRSALREFTRNSKDGRLTTRMTSAFLAIIKTDVVNRRGKRKVTGGNMQLIKDFQFNIGSPLNRTLQLIIASEIVRAEARAGVVVPAFSPGTGILWPEGSTHARLMSAAVEVDFDNTRFALTTFTGEPIERHALSQPEVVISHQIPPASELPVFLLLGVEFFQLAGSEMYPLKNGAFNSLSLVAADGGQ